MFQLGMMNEQGDGGPKDDTAARALYEKAEVADCAVARCIVSAWNRRYGACFRSRGAIRTPERFESRSSGEGCRPPPAPWPVAWSTAPDLAGRSCWIERRQHALSRLSDKTL